MPALWPSSKLALRFDFAVNERQQKLKGAITLFGHHGRKAAFHRVIRIVSAGAVAASAIIGAARADTEIKIGILNTSASGPVYIAVEKGYFAAEKLDPKLIVFDAAQTIAVATASGDVDFGTNGLTAALYTLAGQGAIRIIGAQVREAAGFHTTALIASNAAYAAGMQSVKDFPGHLIAITQIGSAYQYILNLVAAKYGFDPATLKLTAVQSLPNIATSVSGARADGGVLNAAVTMPLLQRDQLKLLSWVGDETPFQIAGLWTSTKIANEQKSTVEGFLRAYRKGAKDFHDAFTNKSEAREDQATAAEIYPILEKYIKQPIDQIKISISYHDPEARLDVKDVLRQIEWYKTQGMIKGPIDGKSTLDDRYVVPLPGS
jgi:NitT/TauT family transport system substrate-binding protein